MDIGPDGAIYTAGGANVWKVSPTGETSIEAGAAPGFVAGATQLNIRVPQGLRLPEDGRVPLMIRVDGTPTQARTRIFVEAQ